MKIESKDFKIKSVFSKRKYIIPDYQRNYSWTTDEEISVFWDDFIYYLNKYEKANFFIGPMVFKGDDVGAEEFEVIDGQQRLITFSILLSVLVSFFLEYNKKELSEGLRQYLVYRDEKNSEQLVITTIEPHPFFQKKIFHFDSDAKPDKPSEECIEQARRFFQSKINELLSKIETNEEKINFLEKVRDYIFNIDTVIIVSNDETDAFTIFETINSRGKDLLSLDLLKNYIFKNIPSRAGIEEPKNTWKEIIDNIHSAREVFFNRFWASWVSKVTENKLYRRFSDYVRNSKENIHFTNPQVLLNELRIAAEIYRKITKPQIDDWKKDKRYYIYTHIKNINGLFGLKVHFPFFLALFEEYQNKSINQEVFNDILLFMENFHFIFTHVVSPRASGLDNKYSKFAIRLREDDNKGLVIKDLKNELFEKLPSFEEYKEKFKVLNFKDNKDTIKFILLKIEKSRDPAISIDFESHSIEHLEPRSSTTHNRINEIGNLFLLEQRYNEDKDDLGPFDIYKNEEESIPVINYLIQHTKYKSTKDNLEQIKIEKTWTDDTIEKRTETLAKLSYELFAKL